MVSGFVAVNSHSKQDEAAHLSSSAESREKEQDEIVHLRGEIECRELEIQSALQRARAAETERDELGHRLDTATSDLSRFESQISELKTTVEQQSEVISRSEEGRKEWTRDREAHRVRLEQANERIEDLQRHGSSISEVEEGRIRVERVNAELQARINELNGTIEELKGQMSVQKSQFESQKAKMKDLKDGLVKESGTSRSQRASLDKMAAELQASRDECQRMVELREAEKEKYSLLKSKTREAYEAIDQLKQLEAALRSELVASEKENESHRATLEEIQGRQKQWELVAKFVHRITDEQSVPTQQLAALFSDSSGEM
jgi:chromosome segregation ATPase